MTLRTVSKLIVFPLSPKGKVSNIQGPEWYSHEFFENFIEDIDEFAAVKTEPKPGNIDIMKDISEAAFKQCMAEIINEQTVKDWGGETSDHYSANLHLSGRRITGAFLLKGPAKIRPTRNSESCFNLEKTSF